MRTSNPDPLPGQAYWEVYFLSVERKGMSRENEVEVIFPAGAQYKAPF